MARVLNPLLLLLAKAVHGQLIRENEFLKVENGVLRSKLKTKVVVTPEDRARLVRFGRELGPAIRNVITIVKPETFRRWIRAAGAAAADAIGMKTGRKPKPENVKALVIRIADENPGWGYQRISGEMRKLDIECCSNTVKKILLEAGMAPRPMRRKDTSSTWNEFVARHADSILAADFFTKEVWTFFGKVTYYVLFFVHLGTRRVHVAGSTLAPNAAWVEQQARNLGFVCEEQGWKPRYMIHDRDSKFTTRFDGILKDRGMRHVRIPRRAPNCNAYAEAWVASLKRECLDHFTCFGQRHLDHILGEYARFYRECRPHQGLGNRTLSPMPQGSPKGEVLCESRLGGLLRHYYRTAG
jgi:putative transposase